MKECNYVEPILDEEEEEEDDDMLDDEDMDTLEDEDGYTYDQALDYLEDKGVNCDPCSDPGDEGEFVCDLLDELFPDMDCDTCSQEDLEGIVERVKDYRVENQDLYDQDEE